MSRNSFPLHQANSSSPAHQSDRSNSRGSASGGTDDQRLFLNPTKVKVDIACSLHSFAPLYSTSLKIETFKKHTTYIEQGGTHKIWLLHL